MAKHELALVRLFGISTDGAVKTGYWVPLPSAMSSAIQLLTENAEAGSWQSQYALAELYQVGYGDIRPDSTESNKWWQRLDAQKDATIQLSVGRHFLAGDPKRYGVGDKKWMGKDLSYDETNRFAFEWFGRAAAQANRDAIWELAAMEYNGIGTPKNLARALQLHRKAAELGQVDAMYQLGIAYMNGIGVERDYPSAMRWLARSAAYGDAYGRNPVRSSAQNAIGSIYENGYGVTSDLALAYAWYSLASAGSSEEESKNLLRVQQKLTPDELVRARSIAQREYQRIQPNWFPQQGELALVQFRSASLCVRSTVDAALQHCVLSRPARHLSPDARSNTAATCRPAIRVIPCNG